ncbi:serine acetyltransferase [Riemerella anatipestifer]|uniref:serine O-acetyltransferase n=1 Tax=Riemerella anatipestifer TaxID=34085 RepID=UPI001BDA3CD1|nr:serine acetyltransferase [Riemerella anatipestifer]MBT0533898.1 serine acetyltransferase [Riemerella anatipestifer]MBT0539569.1 serine acetyltransferase [Riemerella anatipestifer]MBT0543310.1 serine acetyltransferase [Riemerella anatipestifer]MBT0545463.1 serine acetyltransferase [Riemerella anatipestifer]MBT0547399.1 serine acetyltransferase [Riemerella anatipestifer]
MNYTTIQKDFYRESGKWLSGIQVLKKCFSPNLHYIYWFRKAQKYRSTPFLGFIVRFILRHYQIKYGFQIYPETQIGEGFYLGHWGAVVINPKTIIGKNCNIEQGVTIGQQNRGKKQGVPTIGDEVWIGANAVIVGGITIGNNVLIAPNAYVNTDVSSGSVVIVMGNPAQIIPNDQATEGYINHKV